MKNKSKNNLVNEEVKWDLSNIYKSLDSNDLKKDWKYLQNIIESTEKYFLDNNISKTNAKKFKLFNKETAEIIAHAFLLLNQISLYYETIDAYVSAYHATDSYNKAALKKMSELEILGVKFKKLYTLFKGFIGVIGKQLPKLYKLNKYLNEHKFCLDEIYHQSKYLMNEEMEDLASKLSLSGAYSFSKLHGTLTSKLKVSLKLNDKEEIMPINVVRNLAYDPSENVRKAAYEAEIKGWESIAEPLAFSLNSIKWHLLTLNSFRNRRSYIHNSLDLNRIDEQILNALLTAMKKSLPFFKKYFLKKAKRLGESKLSWWNLFAPVGSSNLKFTYDQACDFIIENFKKFSTKLSNFAKHAFKNNWIDVYPRDGKRGGAFCTAIPKIDESRILCNFDGSFDQVLTIAHELGHAYHNECHKGLSMALRSTPMTLAETASIFCETIILNSVLESVNDNEKLSVLEVQLINASQTIVDIYSRYLFEKSVFEAREKGELSVDDFCNLMISAQKEAYGDALNEETLHKYMWAVKPHYYIPDYPFYNYPYAFGFLFGLGLYKIYESEGKKFIQLYDDLLRSTGSYNVKDLTKKFSIDVTDEKFWLDSIEVVKKYIELYLKI